MKKLKLVRSIIGEELQKYGFEYAGGDAGFGYSFVRYVGEVKQTIMVEFIHSQYVRLAFSTNAYGRVPIGSDELVELGKRRMTMYGIRWEDEQSFKEALEISKEIILEKGLDKLEEMNQPTTEIRPKKHTDLYLFENNERLNVEYSKKLGISKDSTPEQVIERIELYLKEVADQEFIDIEMDLVGVAAVYGNLIINKLGGDWIVGEDRACRIININNDNYMSCYSLDYIITIWEMKEYSMLYSNFDFYSGKI